MKNSAFKTITLKGISLFLYLNVLRVLVVLVALYFSSIFIFNTDQTAMQVLQEWRFHFIVLSSLLSISAGYIIHHFYEEELLRVQYPFQSYLKQFISKTEYLSLYLVLNVISLILAAWVSWKILLFFMLYQFLIWLYSHKLSPKAGVANLSKTLLTLLPFVALMYYFQNYSFKVLAFGGLLFILILLKEILKDFNTAKSDALFAHESLPNTLGVQKTTPLVMSLLIVATFANLFIAMYYQLGIMEVYLYSSALIYGLIISLLNSHFNKKFAWSLWLLKLWIFVGICSIPFINWNLIDVINRIQ